MRCSIIWKGNAGEAGWVRKVLALIKSLIYEREEEDTLEARLNKIDQSRSKLSTDKALNSTGQSKLSILNIKANQ